MYFRLVSASRVVVCSTLDKVVLLPAILGMTDTDSFVIILMRSSTVSATDDTPNRRHSLGCDKICVLVLYVVIVDDLKASVVVVDCLNGCSTDETTDLHESNLDLTVVLIDVIARLLSINPFAVVDLRSSTVSVARDTGPATLNIPPECWYPTRADEYNCQIRLYE